VELKVDVNIPEIPVRLAVDNVRLYPNPAHNPVTIVVSGGVSGNKPALPIHNQKVQIFEEGSRRLLGEALTDEGGEAHVSLRTDVLFPVAAAITVWDGTKPVVQAKIAGKAVSGLYPGDVWALDFEAQAAEERLGRANSIEFLGTVCCHIGELKPSRRELGGVACAGPVGGWESGIRSAKDAEGSARRVGKGDLKPGIG
jgi:hypothetical protein